RLRPLPLSTDFTSSSLRISIVPSLRGGGWSRGARRRLGNGSELDEQSVEVLDDVAPVGARVRHAGDAGAADDRGVGADRSEPLDVGSRLDAEADRDRYVRARAQGLEHRHERAGVARPDGAALAARGDE